MTVATNTAWCCMHRSAWGGLWTPCAGSVTPWNTHIGSEEYEPDGKPSTQRTVPHQPTYMHTSRWKLHVGCTPSAQTARLLVEDSQTCLCALAMARWLWYDCIPGQSGSSDTFSLLVRPSS